MRWRSPVLLSPSPAAQDPQRPTFRAGTDLVLVDAGGRGDVSDLISAVGQEAARADVNLYALHLDTKFIEMFSERRLRGHATVDSAPGP